MASSSHSDKDPSRQRQSRWDQREEEPSGRHNDSHRRYRDQERREDRQREREGPYDRKSNASASSGRFESSGALYASKPADSGSKDSEKPEEPQFKPNFKASGALAAAARTNAVGVVLKFAAPAEARQPTLKWRLFPFKGDDALPPIPIHEKSVFLLGRDLDCCDIVLEHLSISGQHAAIVHRQVSQKDPDTGLKSVVVKPFLIDLESRNGTFLNDVRIEDSRYYELIEKDCIKFGASTREYVILNEKTK